MVLTLVVALLSSQVIYEWIDSEGDSHFTDDVSTIPARAKRRTTTGAEPVLSVPRAETRDAGLTRPDAGAQLDAGLTRADAGVAQVAAKPSGPDSCERANKRIEEIEQQQQREKQAFTQQVEAEQQQCQTALNTLGQAGYSRCMAGRTQRQPPSGAGAQLEDARDALRRAQVEGCR